MTTLRLPVPASMRLWRSGRRAPSLALVCLPYAGGATAAFRGWAQLLPDDVELVVVRYPGREQRYGEPASFGWDDLVADCARAVAPYLNAVPSVLFGHSMGALLAHELTAQFATHGCQPPVALAVSEHHAPFQRTQPWLAPDSDDRAIADWLLRYGNLPAQALADQGLRTIAINLLRADLTAYRQYRPGPRIRHHTPVQVLYAAAGQIDDRHAQYWAETTTAECTMRRLPGGHFYTPPVWKALPSYILAGLAT